MARPSALQRVSEFADRRIAEAQCMAGKYLRKAQELAQHAAEKEAEEAVAKKKAEAEARKATASAEKKAERAAQKRAAEVAVTQAETADAEVESGTGNGTCYRCWVNEILCVCQGVTSELRVGGVRRFGDRKWSWRSSGDQRCRRTGCSRTM